MEIRPAELVASWLSPVTVRDCLSDLTALISPFCVAQQRRVGSACSTLDGSPADSCRARPVSFGRCSSRLT